MKRKNFERILFLPILLFCLDGAARDRTTRIGADDPRIQYQGRIGRANGGVAEIYWPGSSAKIKFRGTGLKAVLRDEKGYNYFNVIIDDSPVTAIRLDTTEKTYVLASGLPEGTHTIELSKRADWFRGKTWFYGFETDEGAQLFRLPEKKETIEFYGNSITVGAAVEDYHGDSGDSTMTNNYRSYASITARHFKANYSCIASSGIGLMLSWGSLIMPEIYDRLNPDDSLSKWDFSRAKADIVVINLFQNDCALVNLPDHPQFKRRFGDRAPSQDFIINAYRKFVTDIRRHYPEAAIICVLGSMDAVKAGS
ncbi:MAG TPA: hypothetical protein VGM24_00650, partial [Puia sp.]